MPPLLNWPLDRIQGGNEATCFDAVRSNYLLDFHGSIQDPQLVLFMAGNQFRALPELTAAAAAAWREFLLGPTAGAILNRHGFDRPGQR